MVAAAWRETEADRGEPVGESPRGAEAASPLEAMSTQWIVVRMQRWLRNSRLNGDRDEVLKDGRGVVRVRWRDAGVR